MFRKHYYGNARFLGRRALRPYLRAEHGVLLGHSKHGLLLDPEPNHTLLFAPTRSGKGVSFVIPNALTWRGSLFVLDPKGEAFRATAGFRARHQPVYVWGPTLAGHGWNALDELRASDQLDVHALKLATVIVPDQRGGDSFWTLAARNVLSPLLCFLALHDDDTDLASVYDLLPVFDAFLDYIAGREDLPDFVATPLRTFAGYDQKLRASILATLESRLGPWVSPVTRAATRRSDFRLSDFFAEPSTIYLWAKPSDFDSHKLVITLFCQALLTAAMQVEGRSNPTLLLLDEFPLLGPLPLLTSAIALLAGYNVRVALVAQDTTQLPEQARNEILANTRAKIFFKPVDPQTPKYLSELSGQCTLRVETKSRSKHGTSRSESCQPRPLMRPDEIAALPDDQALYFLKEGLHRGKKRPFFDDPLFADRLLEPPDLPTPSDVTGSAPPSIHRLVSLLRSSHATDQDITPAPAPPPRINATTSHPAATAAIDDVLDLPEDKALETLERFLAGQPDTLTELEPHHEPEKEDTDHDHHTTPVSTSAPYQHQPHPDLDGPPVPATTNGVSTGATEPSDPL